MIKTTDGLWNSGFTPEGRKFALCLIGDNNIEVGQWDPKLNVWAFKNYSLTEPYIVAWCAIPYHQMLNPKVVEIMQVEYI
jgi:hypothetical protein